MFLIEWRWVLLDNIDLLLLLLFLFLLPPPLLLLLRLSF